MKSVSQKTLTGHPKGGAAAWQIIGLCQTMAGGVIPGNRNLDSVDEAMISVTLATDMLNSPAGYFKCSCF